MAIDPNLVAQNLGLNESENIVCIIDQNQDFMN
jgi:hypothetical protein